MSFFKNKINIILIAILCAAISGIGYFTYVLISNNSKLYAPDFNNKTIDDVNNWCLQVGLYEGCVITYEYDDTSPIDTVIYQSVKAGDEVSSKIEFIISNGIEETIINIPELNNLTNKDVDEWAKKNNLVNVKYNYNFNNDYPEDIVYKIEPEIIKDVNTKINVYISLGVEKDTQEYIKIASGKYLGLTFDEFKQKVEAIGLKVGEHVSSYDEYSDDYEKGEIIWHGSGDQYVLNEGVRYALSLGKAIKLDSEKYLGLNETEFKKAMSELGLKVYNDGDDRKSNYDKGLIRWYKTDISYGEGDTVNYSVSSGKAISLDASKYLGYKENDFVKAMKDLGLQAANDGDDKLSDYEEGLIRWYKSDGITYSDGDTVKYSISSGIKVNISSTKYIGLTEDKFISAMTDLGMKVSKEQESKETEYDKGIVYSYDSGGLKKGSTIKYYVSAGKKIVYTLSANDYSGKTEDEFISDMRNKGLNYTTSKQYSDSVANGYVISIAAGTYNKADTVAAVISQGSKPKTKLKIMSVDMYNNLYVSDVDSYDDMVNILKNGPFSGFSNVKYEACDNAEKMKDLSPGLIVNISVNGTTSYVTNGYYDYDSAVIITICP